jgi:hypothetical protein
MREALLAYSARVRQARIEQYERNVDRYMHGRIAQHEPKPPDPEPDGDDE